MAKVNSIGDGVPMNLKQMREYLQSYYGIPIALRKEGDTTVVCPFCNKKHEHGTETGHHITGCEGDDRYIGISIGDRQFVPSYGYTICEYKEGEDTNELIIPDNLLD